MHGHSLASNAGGARARLRELGLRPRRGLSQSFLEDQRVAAAIVRLAHLHPDQDEVLEVGPGLGVLTRRLVERAARVVAVELDQALGEALRGAVRSARLSVETADILSVDPARFFERDFVVVANLPYHITSPALRHLLRAGPPYARRLVVMLQLEVGRRLAAQPGQLSALAVLTQAQAQVHLARSVPRMAFYPQPNVDSAVLVLEPLAEKQRLVARAELGPFSSLVQAGFKQPRKQLANSLAEGLGIPKTEAAARLLAAGLAPTRRPQELAVDDWVRLFRTG